MCLDAVRAQEVDLRVDTETAIDSTIEPKLIEAFGLHVASSLLTRATLCYVLAGGTEPKRYEAFVHSICSDARVVHAWGASGASEQEREWTRLKEAHSDRRDS